MNFNLTETFKGFTPYINGANKMRKYSVLIPIVEKNNETFIVFQVRSRTLKSQPGEICFPGGRIEPNESQLNAAIRETCEEMGVTSTDIEIISPLDIFVSPFNFIVNPFIGRLNNFECSNINKDEVDHVFFVPLDYLLECEPLEYINSIGVNRCDDFPFDLIKNENYKFKTSPYPTQFYIYGDYVIWGLTAKILGNFLDVIRNSKNT